MQKPDYAGGSIVNLMSSLLASLGGEPTYPTLHAELEMPSLAKRRTVLMIIDGLGEAYLHKYGDPEIWQPYLRGRLTSVCPTTTASAITSFFTAEAPLQHGMAGWFTYFRELGSILAVLPFCHRLGGAPLSAHGIDPAALIGHTSIFERIKVSGHLLQPAYITESDFSVANSRTAQRHGYRSLDQYFAQIVKVVNSEPGAFYLHAYWAELDALGHRYGIESPQAIKHFRQIERGFSQLIEMLSGSDTRLVLTADHGQIDSDAEHLLQLEKHPQLEAMLRLPLSGEPRLAYCHIKPGREEAFQNYLHEHLDQQLHCFASQQLIEEGFFGLGEMSAHLRERFGDYVLVMKGHYVIKDCLPGEKEFSLIGIHGGLSDEEMFVPLVVV